MGRRLALVGAAVVVALGCDHAHTPKADLVRDCDSRVEGGHVPSSPRGDLDAGPIVFYGLRSAGREALRDPRHAFQTEKGEYPPVKTVTEVAASTVVTVSIARGDRHRAALLYRNKGGYRAIGYRISDGQRVVRFESCPRDQRAFSRRGVVGPRTQYNGGYVFSEPQCLHLDVVVRGKSGARHYLVPYGIPESRCRSSG